MTTFLIGTNRFEECNTLIAHRGDPVLRIELDSGFTPVVQLRMPPGTEPLVIEHNFATQGDAEIIAKPLTTSVVHRDTIILQAVVTNGVVLVHLDLRPLGAAIYTDAAGLHVGGNVLSGNTVRGANVAIGIS